MDATLNCLNVVMALTLWFKPGCRKFAFIQCLQLLEIVPMASAGIAKWMAFDQFNILVEGGAVLATRELKWAQSLMLIHAYMKLFRYADIDCFYELHKNFLYWTIACLNDLILFVLLGYALHNLTLQAKEFFYARRSIAYRPDHAAERPPSAAVQQ